MNWKEELEKTLPLLGHRNWILVVDKAFPLQSSPSMKVIETGGELPYILKSTFESINAQNHIRPIIYTDKELGYIQESFCPGIDNIRQDIYDIIQANTTNGKPLTIPHEEIFSKMDEASKLFNIIVLKTEATFAYTSVFMELDCKYWSSDQEKEMRSLMAK